MNTHRTAPATLINLGAVTGKLSAEEKKQLTALEKTWGEWMATLERHSPANATRELKATRREAVAAAKPQMDDAAIRRSQKGQWREFKAARRTVKDALKQWHQAEAVPFILHVRTRALTEAKKALEEITAGEKAICGQLGFPYAPSPWTDALDYTIDLRSKPDKVLEIAPQQPSHALAEFVKI